MSFIPYGRQLISQDDIDAVAEVLRGDFLTQGPKVGEFERGVSDAVGASHAVACNSGTSALHIACLALGLGEGDYLWTSPNSFVASANCARYCGASVDFVDIDLHTGNMDVNRLQEKLIHARQHGKLPKVVVPVHFAGQPCEMAEIGRLAQEYGFYVIEDASHALGAQYHGAPVGSSQYSDITVFSFHPVKIITSGEGGMAVTNNPVFAEKMRLFVSHGITKDPEHLSQNDGPWYYEQQELGFNYRMTDIHAALGVSQLTRLGEWVARRNQLAEHYHDLLQSLPVTPLEVISQVISSYHLYVIRLDLNEIKIGRRQLVERLRGQGIGVQIHYIPIHTQPYYSKLGFSKGDFPVAEQYYQEALSLPLFPAMSEEDLDRVAVALKSSIN
ncbi:UDP-4-amino-4,6-dideoxy-N-acetyl-beta-L-altrosamine transaminase [Hahella sp. CCB-MM4]|uniref:UDP-4-amino-4, 6-dideoxy-N-acetyl-beta-L-altrosamine transaminase n=1 Tax=Hahella sp. (strain CCB-MM4) TaxID=1926491 RepID=UPI000B9BC85E|nr:UDP-4-amino-4,6-dideoxy-N-acetyl-beta-L-altrosamine transaminase [Hahella sp. CCB-MM4]OZG73782.1 UDP-4-amino-4,6-dideoxy-N-acetyl-beta-L-altrosamine transaminase [Hahella sp. CCB-MM4]